MPRVLNARVKPAACLCAVALAAALGVFVSPRSALATRDYAKAEGKDCSFCHVSDKGSGPRNPKGQEYEANGHKFGVQSWTTDENRLKFLRASSPIVAQWYAEATKLLDELAKSETLPGGVALVEGTRARFKMFKGPWLRNAKKLLALGDRGLPNGLMFLSRVESQFGGSDEGKEAATLLDAMAKDAKTKDAVLEARATERARLLLLEGVTEFQLGNRDKAKSLLDKAAAAPESKAFERELREALAALTPAK
jgi:hypothetical protein